MSDQIRLGIIGIGNMGTEHCLKILGGQTPGIALTAVADRREERRAYAAAHFPKEVQIFSEGSDLIASGLCDAVLIATPHYQHPTLAIEAFAKGLHVLSEKPAGVYTKAVRQMNEAAAQSGKTFALMYNQRTNCVYRKIKEMLSSGELGQIKRVNWIITDWFRTKLYYDSGNWRATWKGEGGGVLLNQCPHQLDLLQWLCGMPKRVRAFCHNGKWHDIEVEDDVTAYLEYENGATGVFVTTTGDAPGTNRLEITLDHGKLVCENDTITLIRSAVPVSEFINTSRDAFAKPETTTAVIETDGKNEQHVGVMNAFAAHILRGEKLIADGAEGINGLTLSNAMHLSAWLDETVTIPFDEDLFERELMARCEASVEKTNEERTFSTDHSYGGATVKQGGFGK